MSAMTEFSLDWCCWAADGWENAACEGTVRDATTTTRGQAAAAVARETGEPLTNVRVWKRYIRPLSRQEIWDYYGRERWAYRHDLDLDDEGPESPPDDWQPDEYDPSWVFVHRSHPEALAAWIVGWKGDDPPENPRPA